MGRKQNIKIIVLEDNTDFKFACREALVQEGFTNVKLSSSPRDVVDNVKMGDIDVLVFGMNLSSVSVHKFLKAVHNADFDDSVLLIAFGSDEKDKTLADILKTDKYFNFSDGFDGLTESLYTLFREENFGTSHKTHILDKFILKYLNNFGILPSIRGYYYLYDAIFFKIEHLKELVPITKNLYPYIAKKYDTTPNKVERAIRNAIVSAWQRYDNKFFDDIFSVLEGRKPTNNEFICAIAVKIADDLQNYIFQQDK